MKPLAMFPTPMFVALSSLRAERAVAEDLEARFRARSRRVDAHAGFRRLRLLRARGTDEYLLVLEWDDFAGFKSYVKSPDFAHAHPPLDDGVQPGGLRVYDTLIDSALGG